MKFDILDYDFLRARVGDDDNNPLSICHRHRGYGAGRWRVESVERLGTRLATLCIQTGTPKNVTTNITRPFDRASQINLG